MEGFFAARRKVFAMKNRIIFLWVGMMALCVILGLFTRASYTDFSSSGINGIKAFKFGGDSFSLESTQCNSMEELAEISELIVRVRLMDDRKFLHLTILSKVDVIDVYKGDKLLKGKSIYIYEPAFINSRSKLYFAISGYSIMKKNSEYVLFLNKKVFPEGYRPDNIEGFSYLITTNSALGKYSIGYNRQESILNTEENKNLTYNDIVEYEVIVDNRKYLELYNTLKMEVMKNFEEINLPGAYP